MAVSTATSLLVEWMPGAGPFDVAGDTYLQLTSAFGQYATTPDHASLDITGDIEVRIDITADSWAAPPGNGMKLFGKGNFSASDRSWLLMMDVNRRVVFRTTADGSTPLDSVSTSALPITSGRLAIRVTLDVNDGSGNRVANFYTAPTISGSWTQLGTTVTTAGTTTIWNSATSLDIGDVQGSGFPGVTGRVHAAEVRNGIGGSVVANPDFTIQTPGATSFSDGAGRTWTITGAIIAGFSWISLTDRLCGPVTWSVGRTDELQPFSPGTADLLLRNDDRQLDPEYTAGTWFGKLRPRTPFRLRSVSTVLSLSGSGSDSASTPDHASFAVTDLDVRIRLAMTDWTPGGFGQFLVGQWPNVGGNNGWVLSMNTSGQPVLTWTTDGTTSIARTCSAATGFTDGSEHWLRVTLDVNNGAAGHTVVFYTSTDGQVWTQLGTTSTTAGTTSIFNSTGSLAVGDILTLAGRVRQVELRSAIAGSVIANPDFSSERPGITSFTDRSSRVWTLNGTAAITTDTTNPQDEFYGFAANGFEQIYGPPKQAECRVYLVDMLEVLNGTPLPAGAYDGEVLADQPEAWWRLDETSGVQMADSSENGRHGDYDNSVLGEPPLVPGSGHAVSFPHVGDNRGRWSGEGLPVAFPCTLEAWIKTDRNLAAIKSIVVAQRDSSLNSALWLQIQTSGGGSPDGEVVVDFFGLGTFYKFRGHTRCDNDEPHHVVCTIGGNTPSDVLLYVDGVLQTKTVITAGNPGPWTSNLTWTVGNVVDTGQGDYGFEGTVDEVAVYGYVLGSDRVAVHYEAGTTAFDNESTGARIGRVLDLIGHPTSQRDVATGDTFAGPATYDSNSAGLYIQAVVESEQGVWFVDHRHGGKLKFRGRYHRITETRSTTTVTAFTDTDATGNLHYERGDLEVDPNSTASLVNVANVEWRGGTVTVTDEASADPNTGYGPQSRSIRTQAANPEVAASAGQWLINRYGQPQVRVRGFKLRPDADKRLWPAVLGLEISDRITVERFPQQVGSSVTNTLTVEGLTHTVSGTDWETQVRTSSAVLGSAWIWDTSTWGVTTVWG